MTSARRRQVLGAVAAGAAAAGAGWAWWRGREAPPGGPMTPVSDADALWDLAFPQPFGPALAMADLRGRPLVLNFWATWCAPCVKEMPELDRFHREHAPRGWHVVGIAIDQMEAVREFLARIPVGFPIAVAGLPGMELMRQLGNTASALPFTVLYGPDGRVRERKLGETSARELAGWAREG